MLNHLNLYTLSFYKIYHYYNHFSLGNLPHKYKLVIAGNHELSFDNTFTHPFQSKHSADRCVHTGTSLLDQIPTLGNTKESITEAVQIENVRQYLTNCIYLQDEQIDIFGLKFYGTPWFV